ncbi:uncharacterized protein LOC144628755 [Oculina patagonica]
MAAVVVESNNRIVVVVELNARIVEEEKVNNKIEEEEEWKNNRIKDDDDDDDDVEEEVNSRIHVLFFRECGWRWSLCATGKMSLMFWTAWLSPPKIWRATLSGTQAVPIVTSNLDTTDGIDLDTQSKLVFWVDAWLDRLGSVDYYGNNRKLLFRAHQQAIFSDLTFLSSYLYVSDYDTKKIYKFNATSASGAAASNVNISQAIYGLVAYDSSKQLPVFPCPALSAPSNGARLGCSGNETMAFNSVCQFSCNNGYIGSGSQVRRCQQDGTWSGQNFTCQTLDVPCNSSCLLVSTQTEIVALDYNNGTSYPIISNLQRAVAIDIHFSLGYIFWSDFIERNIKRANIDGTNVTELHNIGDCFGLAVEWGSSQLYWTDEVRDTISVSDLEGNNTHILISSSLDNPRGIALDPHSGLMFWTDFGHEKIERATLLGTQRVTIVTSNLSWPFSIDLDRRNRLVFWVDGKLDRVESVDYHGNNRKLLFQRQRNDILFYGVTFFSSYLFVSNWANGVVYKFNATNANVAAVSSIQISQRRRIDGLVAYDSSRQSPVITCPALPAPSSGTRLGCPENTTMYYDTVCQFACNNGYIGSGSQVRRCQHNGTWSGQDFTCQIINYTSLTVDPSGPLRMSSCDNHYGAECKLTCTIGYRLNGSSAVACVATGNQHTGVWNSTIPTVKENWKLVTCPVLHAPSNGTRLGCPGNATMYYNTTCQSSCNNGYIGSGSKVRRCQHSGTWSGQDFTCQIINCTLLTIEPSGLLRMSSCDNHYGSQCNFSCTLGHRLNGSSTVTCVAPGNRHPGVWNKAIPTCEASLKTREESVLLEVKDLDIKKWNKQTEKDFKIEVARLATDYCAADGTRCELIPASSRGKRSSDNLVFSRDRVHVLSDYPKQLSDDPLIALIAFYLQFPQALSDDIVVKDVLVAIMESHVSSIERSINGTILSVKPLFSDTETTEESDEESKPTTAIIIGVCVGVLVIIIAVVWACKRINSSKKMAETSSYNNNAYVGNTTNYITSEGQVTEMKNMESYALLI